VNAAEVAVEIAAHTRRFTLLADRPDLLYPEPGQRAERVLADDTKAPLDKMLVAGASDSDLVCAAAVAMLRQVVPKPEPILSLLSVLPAERLLGIYYALPEDRREQCEEDDVWAYHLRHAPDGIEFAQEALADIAVVDLADVPEQALGPDEGAAFRRVTQRLMRESLGMAGDEV
jgi:hypothetical protein